MKATLLLHGGRLRNKDPRNDSYFRRLSDGLDDGDIVLFVGFARDDITDEQTQYEQEKEWILRQTDKNIAVEMATREGFIEQVRRAKSIEITGGDSPKLVEIIRSYPEFTDAIDGKVIGGSSAGAYLFATHYYDNPTKRVRAGLGLLPIKISVHMDNPEFGSPTEKRQALDIITDDTELVILDEAEWIEREATTP